MNIRINRARGFTLAELMVTVAITVILLGILFNVANLATKTMDTASARVDREENASNSLDAIGTDIETIVIVPGSDKAWLSVGESAVEADDTDYQTWHGTETNGIVNSAGLCFFTAARDRYDGQIGVTNVDMGGDVSCVAYQLFWRNDVNTVTTPTAGIDEDKKFTMFRSLVFPDDTYTHTLGEDDVRVEMFDGDMTVDTGRGTGKDFVNVNDVIGYNVYEMTVTFEVEYRTSAGVKQTSFVTIIPPKSNTDDNVGLGKGHWAQIRGDSFLSDAHYSGSTSFETAIANGTIYGVKALNMTVSLNIMDDTTQAIAGKKGNEGFEHSREQILQGCRVFSRTYSLPKF